MYNPLYLHEKRKQKKTSSYISEERALQQRPFTMQLKTLSQQPDLKTSFSRAERYGHHLDTIQCASLFNAVPIQMLSTLEEEEKKLTSGMDLKINKLPNKKKVLEKVVSVASRLKILNNQKDINIEPKKHFAEKTESVTETSKSKDKDKKENSDEHLTSPAKSKISDNQAKEESSQFQDPEVTRLLNKSTQSNLEGSGGGIQQNNQEKQFVDPPSTYNENKSAPSPKVGTHGQSLAKREAIDLLGNNKGFATTQRAVKIPVTNTDKFESSKAEDSKQQVKLKDAAELVRDQVVNEDRQVKEYLRGRLNLDPAIVAKKGGEQLILQKMQ